MVSEETYFLREATGPGAVAETAPMAAEAQDIYLETWDALQAEK